MKKVLFSTLLALSLATTAILFASCKPEEEKPQPSDTIEIDFENPRYMAVDDDNIYITCYYPMAVVRFNKAQNTFTGICKLGKFHPEGIAAVGGKLYIASSNISDESGNYSYDNKLYVVDIATFKLMDSITIGRNPNIVKKLDNSHIVFNTWNVYNGSTVVSEGSTYILNTDSKEIVDLNVAMNDFEVYNGDIYGYESSYTYGATFYKVSGATHQVSEILDGFSTSDGIYGISVNPYNGDIIALSDGNYISAGDCYVFANDGSPRMGPVQMGLLPKKAVALDASNLLVLNEGGWGSNNAGISRVDVSDNTATVNYFADNNGRGLGDVAQDILLADGKAFITVTFSNSLEIMNTATGKSTRIATTK
ncbi:MAG: hypothetical protein IKP34_08450 [Bacteroidales bacterium]|nr:hypothetical protein [Bacteroidales bacterium]